MSLNGFEAELQKDFFRPVSGFSNKKCPNYVFSEFCPIMMHEIGQMLVLFSQYSSFGVVLCHKSTAL